MVKARVGFSLILEKLGRQKWYDNGRESNSKRLQNEFTRSEPLDEPGNLANRRVVKMLAAHAVEFIVL